MTTRERLIRLIDDWADDPGSYEEWDSVLKVNILLAVEKEFGVPNLFNSADVPGITGLETLLAFVEPRLSRKKVLVLDCDGVLWGGVAGEGGIEFGLNYIAFQKQVSALEKQGVLVCLCSKNNLADVKGVFYDVVWISIGWDQFAAVEISWDSKVDGLKRLAAKLNLGLDSFVFVDDSPIERAEVRERLPEVTVLAPEEPIAPYFTHLAGKSVTQQYRQAIETRADEIRYSTLDVSPLVAHQMFLDSLDMRAVMRVNDESLAPRIAELSQKTNQFNMTLRRFTEAEIRGRMVHGHVFCASLADRFGDAGWVAMAVFDHFLNEGWKLADFCVSCRVIGRGFERAFIESCMSRLRIVWPQDFHFSYVPGPKNQQCANFFDGQKVAEHVPRAPVKWEE